MKGKTIIFFPDKGVIEINDEMGEDDIRAMVHWLNREEVEAAGGGFLFSLGETAVIGCSGERGKILGRAEYLDDENQYYIQYLANDGRAVENWWRESALLIPGKAE